jgi:hypothetical protein
MEKLTNELDSLIEKLKNKDSFLRELDNIKSVYPFSKYEYIISTLLSKSILSYEQYIEMRDSYINRNLFLYVFEISAPRSFGDTWAFSHLLSIEPDFKRPNKKIDSTYIGEYDMYLKEENIFIKIEVKASRSVDRNKPDEPLYIKALPSDSKKSFLMNFQQLKPSCADVFLWIAVYRNTVKYWVLNSDFVRKHKDFTPQHRNEGTMERDANYIKEDIYEGQIMITDININSISEYEVKGKQLKDAVIKEYNKIS